MKKSTPLFLLSIFWLLIFSIAEGQNPVPLPDTNATWCCGQFFTGWFPPRDTTFYYYQSTGYTTINDTSYIRINGGSRLLREHDRKIFCRYGEDENEFLLYDFNLNVGETMSVPQHDYTTIHYYDGIVQNVDSLLIGSRYHKRIFIDALGWNDFRFIEGIGSEQGLFYCELPWVDWRGVMTCFSANDTIYSTDGSGEISTGNCLPSVNIVPHIPEQIRVYPNPANNVIFISGHSSQVFKLFDIYGNLLLETRSPKIDISVLSPGLYILKVFDNNAGLKTQVKLVKANQ